MLFMLGDTTRLQLIILLPLVDMASQVGVESTLREIALASLL
jgi:hypothetical protein